MVNWKQARADDLALGRIRRHHMSHSVVTIRLNGNPYQIGCGAGEEAHVSKLGEEVESVMQSLVASVGQIGEARLLAMVALILADRAAGQTANAPKDSVLAGTAADQDAAAEALEMAAARITTLATRLTKP
jgi:cell division protein ZapA